MQVGADTNPVPENTAHELLLATPRTEGNTSLIEPEEDNAPDVVIEKR